MSCIRDVNNEEAFESELERMKRAFKDKANDEIMRIEWSFWSLKLKP